MFVMYMFKSLSSKPRKFVHEVTSPCSLQSNGIEKKIELFLIWWML